jgi:hypothetical protein
VSYKLNSTIGLGDIDFDIVYQVFASLPETYIIYAESDGSVIKSPVVAWGVLGDASLVPISIDGPWDDVSNKNSCVLYPDGRCAKFQEQWDTLDAAAAELKELAT